jgi:acetylornithine deacetylase
VSMADAEARVLAAIERLEPAYRVLLQSLVQTPSPVGDEGAAQAIVAGHMRDIGLDVDVFDINASAFAGDQRFNPSPRSYAGRPCVVGTRKGGGGGRSLVLNAHIDTVPVDAPETWTFPPYGGVIENGRIYGRGTADDKAGIVECLLVAHAIREAGLTLAGDLIVSSVVEDESTGNGSLAAVQRGHVGDGVVIVDGTWPERFIVSHMGHVSFQLRLPGTAGHATSPGPNPISAVGQVVTALQDYVSRRNAAQARPWGTNERPHFINLGMVRGGVWPGSVPADCVIEGQCGFPPPETCASAKDALREVLRDLAQSPEWPLASPASITFVGLETPPQVGDARNPIVNLLVETVRERHGAVLQESVISGHCDLRHYTSTTSAACLYGPGGGRNVHGADEYFELAHLPLVAGNLACVALKWCGISDVASGFSRTGRDGQ